MINGSKELTFNDIFSGDLTVEFAKLYENRLGSEYFNGQIYGMGEILETRELVLDEAVFAAKIVSV